MDVRKLGAELLGGFWRVLGGSTATATATLLAAVALTASFPIRV